MCRRIGSFFKHDKSFPRQEIETREKQDNGDRVHEMQGRSRERGGAEEESADFLRPLGTETGLVLAELGGEQEAS